VKIDEKVKGILVGKINKSEWWHVPPQDPDAYNKRGKFLASTYQQAKFYGRPNDMPERVFIANPVYGFSEKEILDQLFPGDNNNLLLGKILNSKRDWYQKRISLDERMFKEAKSLGYDAIVLLGSSGRKELEMNRKPRSIELNLLNTGSILRR